MTFDADRCRRRKGLCHLCCLLVLLVLPSAPVAADEIVLLGARYRDVIVLKSDTTYYVQIPWEGRTISVRIEQVDESTVSISDDAYYRDKLKQEYAAAKELRATGQLNTPTDDPRFQVQARSSSADFNLYQDGEAGSAGGAAGLGVSRTQVETQLSAFGVQFVPGPERGGQPTVVGQMPPGIRIELIGSPDILMGVDVSGSAPAAQAAASASQMQMFVSQIAPGLAPEIAAMVQEAQQSGQSQRSVDGISAIVSMKPSGEEVEFHISIMAVN